MESSSNKESTSKNVARWMVFDAPASTNNASTSTSNNNNAAGTSTSTSNNNNASTSASNNNEVDEATIVERTAEWGLVVKPAVGEDGGGSFRAITSSPRSRHVSGRLAGDSGRLFGDSGRLTTEEYGVPKVSQELKAALATLQQTFVVSDATKPDLPVVYASSGFFEMTGYSAHEVIGNNCPLLRSSLQLFTPPSATAAPPPQLQLCLAATPPPPSSPSPPAHLHPPLAHTITSPLPLHPANSPFSPLSPNPPPLQTTQPRSNHTEQPRPPSPLSPLHLQSPPQLTTTPLPPTSTPFIPPPLFLPPNSPPSSPPRVIHNLHLQSNDPIHSIRHPHIYFSLLPPTSRPPHLQPISDFQHHPTFKPTPQSLHSFSPSVLASPFTFRPPDSSIHLPSTRFFPLSLRYPPVPLSHKPLPTFSFFLFSFVILFM